MPRRKGSPAPIDPEKAPPGTPAFLCARDSGGDTQELSVPSQLAYMEQIAAQRQWVIVDRFVDSARKGGDLSRKGFNRMIERLQERPVAAKILMYWDEKRAARDTGQGMLLQAHCYLAGVALYCASSPTPAAASKWLTPMKFTMAAEESIEQGRDIARGHALMIEAGYAPGGRPDRGYMAQYETVSFFRNGKPRQWPRWVKDPEQAPLVDQVWRMRLGKASLVAISKATGLCRGVVSQLVHDPAYAGFPRWWLNHKALALSDCVGLPTIVPPYVTIAEWLQAQPRQVDHPRREFGGYALSGRCDCACGAPCVVHASSGKRRCLSCGKPWLKASPTCPHCGASADERFGPYKYRCSQRHNYGTCTQSKDTGGKYLEMAILAAVAPLFTGEKLREALAVSREAMEAAYQAADLRRRQLTADLESVQGEINNLIEAIAKVGHSEALAQALRQKEDQAARIKSELASLPANREARYVADEDVDALAELFREKVFHLGKRELRQLVAAMDVHVTLCEDHADVQVAWPPLRLLVPSYSAYVAGSCKRPRKEDLPSTSFVLLSVPLEHKRRRTA